MKLTKKKNLWKFIYTKMKHDAIKLK